MLLDTGTPASAGPRIGRPMLLALAACVALAALSLLVPSAPTYDPWAWIIWGREITQLDLDTVTGPSWKPLPVFFTILFAPLGNIAPELWVLVARAGALLAMVFAFRLGRRLGGNVVAGAAAAGALAIAPWWLRNAMLANSEGLMVACVLGGIDRHLADRRGEAFAWFLGAALLRPEAWPFFGLYGLWLVWAHRDRLVLVAAGFASLPALWLLPELWGSGNLLRAAERAQQPRADSAAFAPNPVRVVLDNATAMLPWPAWIGLLVALVALAAHRRAWAPRAPREARLAVGAIIVVALAWIALVAYMTSDGFSGNQRYLVTPVALLCIAAAAGLGWGARRLGVPTAGPAAIAAAVAAFVLLISPALPELRKNWDSLMYQGELHTQLEDLVAEAGGREPLLRCGTPVTGDFLVPALAWQLGVHAEQVDLEAAPGTVIFRVHTNPGSRAVPPLTGVEDVPVRTLGSTRDWRIVASCR